MKKLFLMAALAATMFSQDAKVGPTPKAPISADPAAPTNKRNLTTEESQAIEIALLRIALLQKQYKISEYQTEIAPIAAEQDKILTAACRSVGVPEDKMKVECGIAGFTADGKPMVDPSGKPIPKEVWWSKPELVNAGAVLGKPAEKK